MKTVLFRASTRGHANHGWLDTYHTFSFAGYFNPERVSFGVLRVLNDDIVDGGEGFGTHPHDNMEIISIPLYGALEHKDSMGNHGVINTGEIQVMSAGTGITHSEFNANKEHPVNFFQIWVFPKKQNVEPRYQQMKFDFQGNKNNWLQVVSPNPEDNNLWIYQDAWFSLGEFDKGTEIEYKIKKEGNGVFLMVIEGEFSYGDQQLYHRDGLGVWDTESITLKANTENARILVMDIPMKK